MSDIGKYITNRSAIYTDPADTMVELDPWDESIGVERAAELGIDMSERHWQVVRFLRHHYQCNGMVHHSRDLVADMDQHFSDLGGRRYLYTLFPHGPVVQASYIAGLPRPPGSVDPSFGSVE